MSALPSAAPRGAQRRARAQFSRLLVAGGTALSAVAGYLNVIGLHVYDISVSHVTGSATRVGVELSGGDLPHLSQSLLAIAAFFFGTVLGGVIVGGTAFSRVRRYGIALMTEGSLLAAAGLAHEPGAVLPALVIAGACGVQNAMASTFYGLIVRTTHVTGIVTDIGVLIGQWLKGAPTEKWKLTMLTSLFFGFLTGGIFGYQALALGTTAALMLPALGCLGAGAVYALNRRRRNNRHISPHQR